MKPAWKISILIAASLLSACSGTGSPSVFRAAATSDAQPVQPATMTVEERLLASANRVDESIRRLSLVEQAKSARPTEPTPAAEDLPDELRMEITVRWTGGAEEVSQMIAAQIGYAFGVVGRRPVNGNFVQIDRRKTMAFEILRDIAIQMKTRAELVIDAQNRRIEVRYAPR